MIRSMIGIVCVLVLFANCFQATAAQVVPPELRLKMQELNSRSSLSELLELVDQGGAQRIMSSAAYHDDFRFRADPVKQMRNWQMQIVDVRSAKILDYNRVVVPVSETNVQDARSAVFNAAQNGMKFLVDFSTDISQRFTRRQREFEALVLAIIPDSPVDVPTRIVAQPSATLPDSGRADYWNYYSDCDRWDVVFVIAWQKENMAKVKEAAKVLPQVVLRPSQFLPLLFSARATPASESD